MDSRPVHVRFVVNEVALGQGFHGVLPFSPATIIPRMFRTHLYMLVSPEGQSDEPWEPSKNGHTFGKRRALDGSNFYCFCLKGVIESEVLTDDLAVSINKHL